MKKRATQPWHVAMVSDITPERFKLDSPVENLVGYYFFVIAMSNRISRYLGIKISDLIVATR